MEMVQSIYTGNYLIWSDLVAITGVLSYKNFLEIIGVFSVSYKLMKTSEKDFFYQ